ncbi:MAG: GNAT family N-acetyltransferase [Ramlibacter sp.]|nr:GNAT family N-acetyltransferase [Ramlibacter sp.]
MRRDALLDAPECADDADPDQSPRTSDRAGGLAGRPGRDRWLDPALRRRHRGPGQERCALDARDAGPVGAAGDRGGLCAADAAGHAAHPRPPGLRKLSRAAGARGLSRRNLHRGANRAGRGSAIGLRWRAGATAGGAGRCLGQRVPGRRLRSGRRRQPGEKTGAGRRLAVRDDRRRRPPGGRGLAGRVLATLAGAAIERGYDQVFLQVAAENATAKSLYRRAGFTPAWTDSYWSQNAP